MDYLKYLPTPVRDRIVAFLVSKAGAILAPLISGAVAWAVAKLTAFLPEAASMVDQEKVTFFLWVAIVSELNRLSNLYATKDAKTIQEALVRVGAKLHVDGWIGDKTVEAFEDRTGIEVRKAIRL